ncbi:hypothetical protein [Bradyrhizobium sp. JYMT SZCCT0428]|uniref:hypothetical protein n=1 Tax=Bradyrhizobium sp. JYMT SZCCT0428 TaxID=2807673 RepID=UPI001BAAE745|nr:hypothetical protein [Bradyrhizobium sp. JYMT SZCCT0428]MBR1149848.1 hypothetical protein [Bradyrhizobium sp. JYMT SZCCT0428]
MDQAELFQAIRGRLYGAVADFQPPPPQLLNISPYLGMSLLQKAIRRGRTELALKAAATLLQQSPERLWRRLACIAFEDVGLGDLDLVAMATAAMAGKRTRGPLGGEWAVASFLTSRMADAIKCRGADDLLLVAENHPDFETQRLQFGFSTIKELTGLITGSEPLPVRALAAWFLLGTDRRPSPRLARRSGDTAALFAALAGILPPCLVEIAQEGHRRSGEVLPIFVALLAPQLQPDLETSEPDEMPPEVMLGPVPGWVVDLYTRPGRAALANFIDGSTRTARWVRLRIPPRRRVTFLGTIVFRLEGQCVRRRLRWTTADELRRLTDYECNGSHCPDATEILQLARTDLGELNAIRAELLEASSHAS